MSRMSHIKYNFFKHNQNIYHTYDVHVYFTVSKQQGEIGMKIVTIYRKDLV